MENRVANSEPAQVRTRDDDAAPDDTGAAAEAPRPSWVHASPTVEHLLEHAEAAVGDRYRIETIAGEGGMGRVFSARDTRLGRRLAIKLLTVLDPNPGEDPGLRAHDRLVAEARAMARLDHPGLCRVEEVSLVGQTPYLAMAWVDGVPFDRHCRGLDARRALTVLLGVLDAVAAMHHDGLVHGDLKPANILVRKDGSPTVVDFGLARAENDPSWSPIPRGGTPGYAAPELLRSGAQIGPEADVFAAGVMLYEILTGRTPFYKNLSPAVTIDLLERGALPLPEEHAPDTPPDLQKICLTALEADPAHRYPDAGAMASDIRRYLRRETVAARPRLLEKRLDDEIHAQLEQTAEWQRLGIITRRQNERITAALTDLGRSESPWVVDSRRLRTSQVALSVGAWMLSLGIAVGLSRAWTALHPAAALTLAWAPGLAALALGVRLQSKGQKRFGIGALLAAQLSLPAALWLTLRHTAWLGGANAPAAIASLIGVPSAGVTDPQILAVASVGLMLAAAFRHHARSAAFTATAAAFGAAAWLAVYAMIGGLDGSPVPALGRAGAWLALLGLVALPVGLSIDAREHDLIRDLGRRRAHRRDAAPVLCGALLAIGAGLTAAAIAVPEWYAAEQVTGAPPAPGDRAWAFFVNGVVYLAAMLAMGGRATPLRRRAGTVLGWIVPAHLLAALLFMEIHESWGVWLPWLVALPVACLACCAASATRQARPVLITGLVFLAAWYVRVFDRIADDVSGDPGWRLALAAAFLVLGPALMLLAWKTPALAARRRLRRWAREHPIRRPLRSKTWR